jgi:hypothetical protein
MPGAPYYAEAVSPLPGRLAPWRVIPAGAEVQVDSAALPLDLVDLALAVVLAAGLEGEHFHVLGEPLQSDQQVSYCHALRVAIAALYVRAIPAGRLGADYVWLTLTPALAGHRRAAPEA